MALPDDKLLIPSEFFVFLGEYVMETGHFGKCLAFSSFPYNGFGPSMSFQEILGSFALEGIDVTAFTPRLRRSPNNSVRQIQGLPPLVRKLPWRMVGGLGTKLTERRFLRAAMTANADFLYSFPDLSLEALSTLRATGLPIIREMIGVHRRTARSIMVEEHEREGLPPFDAISEESTLEEDAWLRNASAIFAPNAHVHDSLVASGIPEENILQTSYGWSPERFPRAHEIRHYEGELVLLFVGRVSYAKGAHLLLRAWREAGHPGRLLLAGSVEPDLAQRMSEELNHESVEQLGFVTDLAPVYASANAFALPTLFEGGPQVTLEGAAHGLPTLVSPMGTGRLVHHEVEGFVIEPHDIAGWSQAIMDLARDPELRRRLGTNARLAADHFRWENVSRERALLIKRFLIASRGSETADRRKLAAEANTQPLSMAPIRNFGK